MIQGTTLGPLIRHLGLSEPNEGVINPAVTPQAIDARSKATVAAMSAVTERLEGLDVEQTAAAEDLLRELRQRAKRVDQASDANGIGVERLVRSGPTKGKPAKRYEVNPVVFARQS